MKLMNLTQIKSWIHEGMQVGAHTSNHIDLSNCEYNQKNEIIDLFFSLKKILSILKTFLIHLENLIVKRQI